MLHSPFVRHRDKVLGYYSTAAWLRSVVLAMWDGQTNKVGLSALAGLDEAHFQAFSELTSHYRLHGESDPELSILVQAINERQSEERAAADRENRLESWCRNTKQCLRKHDVRSGELDDRYEWFESLFDLGKTPEEAARMAATKTS